MLTSSRQLTTSMPRSLFASKKRTFKRQNLFSQNKKKETKSPPNAPSFSPSLCLCWCGMDRGSSTASLEPYLVHSNAPLLSAFLAFALAQLFKLFTTWFKEKRWDSRKIVSSGGMPSSHSATVTALAVAIGLQEGAHSSVFAIALVLACVVMYDASGVRLHAGQQAELLNQIVCELPPEHPVSNVRPLRHSLGHTPIQVIAGSGLGCFIALLMSGSR